MDESRELERQTRLARLAAADEANEYLYRILDIGSTCSRAAGR